MAPPEFGWLSHRTPPGFRRLREDSVCVEGLAEHRALLT